MLLCIETSTKNCSVALVRDGELVAHTDEYGDRYIHGERLHTIIQELVAAQGISLRELQGIVVGEGPGSYTGLRIGVSTAKGLAYALNVPLYSMPTLACFDFSTVNTGTVITVLDARRDEVFAQVWEKTGSQVLSKGPVEAVIVNEQAWAPLRDQIDVTVLGDCNSKMSDLLSEAGFNWTIAPSAFPSAKNMAKFIAEGLQQKVDVAYFEPFYLKDFVAEKSKKKWF